MIVSWEITFNGQIFVCGEKLFSIHNLFFDFQHHGQ